MNLISLFSGAGGLDKGFHNAGFQTVVANEFDPKISPTFKANFPDTYLIEGDIRDIKESELNLESKNRYSVMTNKNEDYLQSNINEIIFVKKKLVKSEKSKISENRNIHIRDKSNNKINTIYNPLQIKIKENDSDTKIGKETILSYDNKIDKKDIKELDKMRKRNIVYINNYEKNNTSKNPLTSNESKGKLNLKKIKKTINEVNPQKEIILSKKTFLQSISSLKQEK